MPRHAQDYSKTIIYKIVNKNANIKDIYIGHTINLSSRIRQHKYNLNNKKNENIYNYKLYSHLRDNGGFDNFEIIEIEKYPCKDIYEATKRERYWYEFYKDYNRLNIQYPNRNHTERTREWRKNNKEKYLESERKYRQSEKRLDYEKKYRETHKEQIKEHYIKNKDKILEKMLIKDKCDICGKEMLKCNILRHKKNMHN